MKPFIVGLTGGIGSGKSAAADRFLALGAAVVDADAIAHELTGPRGAAMPQIQAAFGRAAVSVDGALDRAVMRRLVFAEPARRKQLEAILHPLIRATSEMRVNTAIDQGAPYAVMVIPLLIESGPDRERFARIAVVDCPETLQVARVMMRNGLSAAEVEAIMAVQATREQRLAVADDVIRNDTDLESLRVQVTRLHEHYLAQAEKMRSGG